MKFHHIGVATHNIEKSISDFLLLGYEQHSTKIIFDPLQNVNLAFLSKSLEPTIELVAPVDRKSPVSGILKKSGTTPYHFCYEVLDIQLSTTYLRSKNFVIVTPPTEAIAFENRRVSFLYSTNMGLIELLES